MGDIRAALKEEEQMLARERTTTAGGRRWLSATTLLLVLVASALLAPGAGAAPERKSYTAVVAPDPVGAGQTTSFTLTVVNRATTQQLGSANLTAPGSFSLIGASAPSPGGTATVVGSTGGRLELRSLSLPAGGTLSVTFTAEASCAAGTSVWSIVAKQSNNFSGPPGNNFILDTANSDLLTTISGQCSLRWLTQPSHAQTGTAITSSPYDAAFPPTGGPFVQAEVRSAPYGDASTSRVTFSSATVTLQIGDNPGGLPAALSGTTSATAVAGVATFGPGPRLDAPGPNFTLLATNAIMAAGESVPFDVSDAVCQAPCTTPPTSAGGTRARVTADSSTGVVAASVGIVVEVTCPTDPTPNEQVVAVFPLGIDPNSTMLIETTFDQAILDRPATQVRACLASAEPFTEQDGTAADPVTIAGDALFIGVPADCDRRTPVPPCQLPTIRDNRAGTVTIRLLVPGDDPYKK